MILFEFLGQLAYRYTDPCPLKFDNRFRLRQEIRTAWRNAKLQRWYDRPYKDTVDEAMRQRGHRAN
jgi:hypothetical protein